MCTCMYISIYYVHIQLLTGNIQYTIINWKYTYILYIVMLYNDVLICYNLPIVFTSIFLFYVHNNHFK